MTFASILLAGGQNKRMNGFPKWNLIINGETMLHRSLRILRESSAEVLIVSGGDYQFPNITDQTAGAPVRVVYDPTPFLGPLNGIRTGLKSSDFHYHFVVAADMPFFSLDFVHYMLDIAITNQVDLVIPKWNGKLQPLHGIYTKPMFRSMENDLRDGKYSLVKWILEQENRLIIDEQVVKNFNLNQRIFFNMNQPDDYHLALDWIKEEHRERDIKGN